MKEQGKKKEWIKTFAIIFLSVLLVLTFFSNTIQNYSLPEVAAQYTSSGQITNKVRGQGVVEASDPYSVVAKETRTVASVMAKVGDEVNKGDVLYVLEVGESEELKEAEAKYESLVAAYEKAIISGQISSSVTNEVANGGISNFAEQQAKIEKAQKKVKSLQSSLENLQREQNSFLNGTAAYVAEKKNMEDLRAALSAWQTQDSLNASALASAESEYNSAKSVYISAKDRTDAYLEVSGNDVSDNNYQVLKGVSDEAYKTYKAKEEAYNNAQNAKNNSVNQINNYTNEINNYQKVIDNKTFEYEYQISETQKQLTKAQADLDELVSKISTEMDLSSQLKAIEDQKLLVDKLRDSVGGEEITSPVTGTILTMSLVAGENINKGDTISTIQMAGKGYTLSMSVTNEQAMLLSVGDEAEVSNSWWYSDVQARITSIRPDPANPASGKKVTFELAGDVTGGQTLSLTVGRRTANYDNIVPNNAIHEDNNGKFIYRIKMKSTPLGTRYILERVDVKVLATDDTQSAVSGALEGWDYIATTSSKPLADGMQVRLKD